MSGFLSSVAGDILDAFASASVRIALPYVLHGISSGMSANAVLSALQGGGLGIRRSTGLKLIKALRTQAPAPFGPSGLKPDQFVDPTLFRFAAYPTSRLYTYVVRVEGLSGVTGEIRTQYINLSSDLALTNGSIETQVNTVMDLGAANYQMAVRNHTVEEVRVSPIFGL